MPDIGWTIVVLKRIAGIVGGFVGTTDSQTLENKTINTNNNTITLASESQAGIVELASSVETASGLAVQASDTRLSDSRTPSGSASGDLTGSYPGPTVTANAITNTKLADMVGFTIKAKPDTGTGDPTDLAISTNTVIGRVGGDIVSAQLVNAQITDGTIQYSKIQNVTDVRLLGRSAGSAGPPQEISIGSGLSLSAGTLSATGGGGGDDISVNTTAATDANFSNATPAAPAGGVNVTWQKDTAAPDNISAHLPANSVSNTVLSDMAGFTIKVKPDTGTGDPTDFAVGTNTVIGRVAGNIVAAQLVTAQVANNAIDNTKLNDMAGFTIKAKPTTGTGDPTDLAIGTNVVIGRVAGDIVAAQLVTAQVANNAIDNTKLNDMAGFTIKAKADTGTGDPTDFAVGTNTVVGRVAGNIVAAQLVTAQVADNAIDNAKLNDMAGFTIKAKPTTATGDPSDLSVGTNTVVGRVAGDIVAAQLVNAQITDGTIQYAKIQNVTDARLLGRSAGSAGAPQEITVGSGLSLSGGSLTATGGGSGFDPIQLAREMVWWYDDFFGVPSSTTPIGPAGLLVVSSGSGSGVSVFDNSQSETFGENQFNTGVSSSGRAAISQTTGSGTTHSFQVGQGVITLEGKIRTLADLSTSTQRFKIIFGFTDSPTTGTVNDGVYFEYIDNLSSGNWRICTSDDGTRTENDSGVVVASSTFYRLKIVINAAASSIEFFIDGTSVGTITTNIPSADSADAINFMTGIFKSVGTSARGFNIDYAAFKCELTTLR